KLSRNGKRTILDKAKKKKKKSKIAQPDMNHIIFINWSTPPKKGKNVSSDLGKDDFFLFY
ncbi:hypothetical protein ACJX0J_007180, partial [Zea mays]